jgi:hypothetical protein
MLRSIVVELDHTCRWQYRTSSTISLGSLWDSIFCQAPLLGQYSIWLATELRFERSEQVLEVQKSRWQLVNSLLVRIPWWVLSVRFLIGLQGFLPNDQLQIFGYARSKMTSTELHNRLRGYAQSLESTQESFLNDMCLWLWRACESTSHGHKIKVVWGVLFDNMDTWASKFGE